MNASQFKRQNDIPFWWLGHGKEIEIFWVQRANGELNIWDTNVLEELAIQKWNNDGIKYYFIIIIIKNRIKASKFSYMIDPSHSIKVYMFSYYSISQQFREVDERGRYFQHL